MEIYQKEKIYTDEKEVMDMNKECSGNTEEIIATTQNKAEQEIGIEKQGSVGKDEQLDDTCDIEATSARRNVVVDEEEEECIGLQHENDNDQVNLTAAVSKLTHSQVVTTESVEVHEMLPQEVCIQQDQVVKPSTEIDTELDPKEEAAMEESKTQAVTMTLLEVHKE